MRWAGARHGRAGRRCRRDGAPCFPGPFLGTVWAGTLIELANAKSKRLAACRGRVEGCRGVVEPEASWNTADVQLKARAAGNGFKLDGRKAFVSDAATADVIVCAARASDGLTLLAVDSRTRRSHHADHRNRPNAQVLRRRLRRCRGRGRRRAGHRRRSRRSARSFDASGRARRLADMLGGMQWMLEDTVEYAKTRQQFGKLIGSFQAVQHMCADMLLWTESARSAIYFAAWACASRPAPSARCRLPRRTRPTHRARGGQSRRASPRRHRIHLGARLAVVLQAIQSLGDPAGRCHASSRTPGRVGV